MYYLKKRRRERRGRWGGRGEGAGGKQREEGEEKEKKMKRRRSVHFVSSYLADLPHPHPCIFFLLSNHGIIYFLLGPV